MATTTRKRPYAPRLPPAERREQLLDAALELIGERGYGGVSMEGVARAAGVTKPVVYDSFANLDELLRALLDREEERALAELAAAMPADPTADPDELAVAGFVAFLRSVAANPTTWRLILMPAEGTPAAVRDHVDAGRETVRGQLEELVGWGHLDARRSRGPRSGARRREPGRGRRAPRPAHARAGRASSRPSAPASSSARCSPRSEPASDGGGDGRGVELEPDVARVRVHAPDASARSTITRPRPPPSGPGRRMCTPPSPAVVDVAAHEAIRVQPTGELRSVRPGPYLTPLVTSSVTITRRSA